MGLVLICIVRECTNGFLNYIILVACFLQFVWVIISDIGYLATRLVQWLSNPLLRCESRVRFPRRTNIWTYTNRYLNIWFLAITHRFFTQISMCCFVINYFYLLIWVSVILGFLCSIRITQTVGKTKLLSEQYSKSTSIYINRIGNIVDQETFWRHLRSR